MYPCENDQHIIIGKKISQGDKICQNDVMQILALQYTS